MTLTKKLAAEFWVRCGSYWAGHWVYFLFMSSPADKQALQLTPRQQGRSQPTALGRFHPVAIA